MKEIQVHTLCDICVDDGEKKENLYYSDVEVLTLRAEVDEELWEMDICRIHAEEMSAIDFYDTLRELGARVVSEEKTKPKKTGPKTKEDTSVACPECNKVFKRRGTLRDHFQQKHPGKGHVCPLCGLNYASNRSLNHHMGHSHPDYVVEGTEPSEEAIPAHA